MAQLRSLRDAPGTQREYETIFIVRPEANTDSIQEVNNRIRRIVETGEGKLLRVENWGKRKLAYEIKKELKGIYLYWLYLGGSQLVAEIERNLRMLDLVIRYNSVRVDQDVNPDARPSEMDEEAFLAAATTVPDEEDAYLGLSRGQSDGEATGEEGATAEGAEGEAQAAAAEAGEAGESAGESQEKPEPEEKTEPEEKPEPSDEER